MLIRKIEMQNFRQFKGKNEIEFSTDINKNVTIIMGDNGAGKTTLAQAFMWCLYGSNTFKIKELINRDVRDEMMPGDTVDVKVSLWVHANEKENMIVRRMLYFRSNSKVEVRNEEFSVAIKNEKSGEWEFQNSDASDVFVKNMLPKELSRFFFFDGERMDSMSKELEGGRSREFAEAVQGLVGLTSLKNAIMHFKPSVSTSVIGKINEDIKKSSSTKLTDYITKIEGYNELIERSQQELDEIEPRIEYYAEVAINKNREILEMATEIERRQRYEEKTRALEIAKKAKITATDELLKFFSTYSMYYFSMPLIQDALGELKNADKLDKGIPKLHGDTINFLLKRGTCLCGQPLESGNEACQELYKLLAIAPPKSLGQSIGEYVGKQKNNVATVKQYSTTIKMYVKSVRDKQQEIEQLEKEIAEAYNLLTDTSKASTLREQEKMAKKIKAELEEKKRELIGIIANAEKDKKYLESQKETLLLLDEKNKKNRKLLEYAQYIYEDMLQEYETKETCVREDLENEINAIFTEIYDEGITIAVDSKYNISVSVNDVRSSGDALEKNTAQNYAIIFAFISGIISLAKKNRDESNKIYDKKEDETTDGYPLVMDAPLSAFDKTRIQNICVTIPGIAQQVIMFIKDTDGEVAEEHMKERIGERYLINALTQTETVVEKR